MDALAKKHSSTGRPPGPKKFIAVTPRTARVPRKIGAGQAIKQRRIGRIVGRVVFLLAESRGFGYRYGSSRAVDSSRDGRQVAVDRVALATGLTSRRMLVTNVTVGVSGNMDGAGDSAYAKSRCVAT